MLHFIMPSTSVGLSPASSSASRDASSAVTSSGRPMSLANGSWPMPTIGALSRSDTLPRLACLVGAIARVVLDGLADRLDGASDERTAVLGRPVAALLEAGERALEARRHEARHELVGAERRLAI